MDFVTAVKTCFTKYAKFSGRASRSEYWYWMLFTIIGNVVTALFDAFILGDAQLSPANLIFSLATLLPGWGVSIRRLHDVNRSGWWTLLVLTIIGAFVLLYWAIKESDQGPNDYGTLDQ